MTVYELPPDRPYQRTFRLLGWGAIALLLGILIFSLYEPAGLSDSIGHALGWLTGALVLAAILGAAISAVKEGSWKLMRKLRFEISNGKLIEIHEGASSPIVEIPLREIESLAVHSRSLFVMGGTPPRQIGIPKEILGFDILMRELVAASERTPVKVKGNIHLLAFVPLLLMILAYMLLFMSHVHAVVIAAGIVALAFQGVGTYSLWRILRNKTTAKMTILALVSVGCSSLGSFTSVHPPWDELALADGLHGGD